MNLSSPLPPREEYLSSDITFRAGNFPNNPSVEQTTLNNFSK